MAIYDLYGTSVNIAGDKTFSDSAPMLFNGFGDTLKIPEGTTKIVANAFYGLDSMENIEWASTLREIEPGAFYACSIPQNLNLPPFDTLPGGMFKECWPTDETKPLKLSISNGTKNIGNNFLAGFWLESIDIPESVETIGAAAFQGCGGESENEISIHVNGKNIKSISADSFDTPVSIITLDVPVDSIPGAPWGAWRKLSTDKVIVQWSNGTTSYD
jgi:hypothetical protein